MKLRFALAVMSLCAGGAMNAMETDKKESGEESTFNDFDFKEWFSGGSSAGDGLDEKIAAWGPFTWPTKTTAGKRFNASIKNQAFLFKVCLAYFGYKGFKYITSPTKKKKKKYKNREID